MMALISLEKVVYTCTPSIVHPFFNRIKASDIGSRLARGVFWSMAGSVISRGLMLCATVLVARMLGKTVYGELGMIQSTVGMFGVFAGFGLGITATKYIAEFRRSDPARAGRIIALSGFFALGTGGLMALGLLIFAPWLAEHTINAPHLSGVLRIGAIILFINALNGAQTGALSGFEAFKTIAYVNLSIGFISFPILVCGASFGGLTGAVWGLAGNLFFNWLLNHLALRKEARRYGVPFTFRECYRELPILWRFSLPAVLASSMVGPVNWICSTLLVNQPDGYGEMGIYSAANQWYALLMFLPGLTGSVVLPILSERLGQKDTARSTKILSLSIKANILFVLPLILITSLVSPYVMGLYGMDFRNGWPTLVAVLLTTGFISVQTPIGQIIAASGKMWVGFFMNLGWAMVFVLATLLFIHNGAFGLASARALAYFVHLIWVVGFAYYLLTVNMASSNIGVCTIIKSKMEEVEAVNINTKNYWENRFTTGDWEDKLGRDQTRQFAETQKNYLTIPPDFSGRLLDFGCGLGDAIPVYRAAYPHASLIGMDISEAACKKSEERYGSFARFLQGDYTDTPKVDIIIASNIFEHLSNDVKIAAHLLTQCQDLFIITPYRETLTPGTEHINSYDENHFKALGPYDYKIFSSKGWGSHGWSLWFNQYPKNIFRPFLGKPIVRRKRQIMFHFFNGTPPLERDE